MADHISLLFCYISSIFILTISLLCRATDEDSKVHIVYMGSLPEGEYSPLSHHLGILEEVVEGRSVANSLVRNYHRSFNGFAAKLTENERQKLAEMKDVVSVFPSRTFQLHTTRSWDFIGFHEPIKRNHIVESDVIIGFIDTGIWPESASFRDEGFGPAPKKWKGACRGGTNFTCNNLLGQSQSARDNLGHGTHTASTAAGNEVKDASFYGLAQGTARGGVPSARVAAYKVCHPHVGCGGADILAAFDDAIADGVDIISISLGTGYTNEFSEDPFAIGAFHAMQKGILTSHSAGNNGPGYSTISSLAPWILTVAASSTDRRIVDKVVLGNGRTLVGNAVNSFSTNGSKSPLIHGKQGSNRCTEENAAYCQAGCLESSLVKGKIVVCDQSDGDVEAYRVGALGSILRDDRFGDDSSVFPLPASALKENDYDMVVSYMNSTKNPQAGILKSETIKDANAPTVVSFSSRGPNFIAPDIMKPDISAPGVDILAAFSPIVSPSKNPQDGRRVSYNILSGTSMACPHATGVAAYVKTFHPDWSPSSIKSSLMTTAWPMNAFRSTGGEFAYGSGHINPIKSINPGLVYEALTEDYIKMLCSMGYDGEKLRRMSGDNSTCPKDSKNASPKDLNYPSMTARVSSMEKFMITFSRTVKNVGFRNSTYTAKIFPNSKITIKVVPSVLSFKSLNEKKSFVVSVTGTGLPYMSMVSASLVWSDGTHSVRSPIVVHNFKESDESFIPV